MGKSSLEISFGFAIIISCYWSISYAVGNKCQCEFPKHNTNSDTLKKLIEPLCGNRYFAAEEDVVDGYVFNVGICTHAEQIPSVLNLFAGVVQTSKKDQTKHVLGSINKTEIMIGTNWILLEYEGGDVYGRSCGTENRRTNIMITCNPTETVGKFRYIEENHNKSGDCYYLFELEHTVACSADNNKNLSAGSVICIFVACVAALYLIGGVLFMRICRRAKGLHQIPNYSFWRDFGALQADGCDLICRCGSRGVDSKGSYHGIGDRQIECAADNIEEFDDHLLPM